MNKTRKDNTPKAPQKHLDRQVVLGERGFRKFTEKQFVSDLPVGYALIGKYTGYNDQHLFEHTCGIRFQCAAQSLVREVASCPCTQDKVRVYTESIVIHRLKERNPDWTLVDFKNPKSVVLIHECGLEQEVVPKDFFSSRRRGTCCTRCFGKAGVCLTAEQMQEELPRGYTVVRRFWKRVRGNRRPVYRVRHDRCGNETEMFSEGRFNTCVCKPCRLRNNGWKWVKHSGRLFHVQGIEDVALRWIIENGKADVKEIVCHTNSTFDDKPPAIRYSLGGESKTYYPDFFIPSQRRVVEVKDINSFGLTYDGGWFQDALRINKAKAKAVAKAGYQFTLLVFDRDTGRVKIPENWLTLSKAELQSEMKPR